MARQGRRKHKCLCCKLWFTPDPRKREGQRYCSRTQCQRASKAASQQRWLHKSENEHYFQGPEHVERVQRWRRVHPQYWRQYRPLQDVIDTQVTDSKVYLCDINGPLQDEIATAARHRLERDGSSRSGVHGVDQPGPTSCR
jgi:hypothetical protein